MRRPIQALVAFLALYTAVGSAFGATRAAYTLTVHLRDGKTVVCAVNQPRSMQPATMQKLSARERVEAQIDATARLRRQPGNKNHYPSQATAPRVSCG